VLGLGFLFNSSAVQHRAILTRNMRFGALAVIDTLALFAGIATGITLALLGMGYWSLVIMTVAPTAAGAIATWVATGWMPGRPRRRSGVRSMLMFGGTLTCNSVIVYLAYNADKILVGRFCGAGALGLYGRAYQLINIPTDNLNSTVSQVALPALARLQSDPKRLRSYFLQGYGLFVAVLVPVTCAFALFADDVVLVFLGRRWLDAAGLLRLLAPTILVFALINPLGWLMLATGRTMRSLKIALVLAPVVIAGYSIGLAGGASGVALGFSAAMVLLAPPTVCWATHGTPITARDIFNQVAPLLIPIGASAGIVLALGTSIRQLHAAPVRLIVETSVLVAVYLFVLLVAMDRKTTYAGIIHDLRSWTRPAKVQTA
jgi:O-antigen/teichoic acid export membrane protein